jgi:amino acid permease
MISQACTGLWLFTLLIIVVGVCMYHIGFINGEARQEEKERNRRERDKK